MAPRPGSELEDFATCGRGMRPLFVSHDAVLTAFAAVHLAEGDCEVATAETEDEAWRKLSSDPFDVLLIDLDMPSWTGFALLQRIRSSPAVARTPVMVCSQREDTAGVERAFNDGATGFFTKPINWRLLTYQVRFAWRAHRIEVERSEAELDALTRRVMSDSAGLLSEAMQGNEELREQARRYASALGSLAGRGRRGAG